MCDWNGYITEGEVDEKDRRIAELEEDRRILIAAGNKVIEELRAKLAEADVRLQDMDHHMREVHGIHSHEAML